jgi:hypothetical protein
VLDVREFDDYRAVAARLREHQRHVGGNDEDEEDDDEAFGVLIGCSGHSPVPAHLVDKVAAALHRHAIRRHRLKAVWGGGDPCFRLRNRGGNVADVARALLRIHAINAAATDDDDDDEAKGELVIAAVQREDHAGKVPSFERVVVSYRAALAEVGGRVTFGGYETEAPPAYRAFLAALRREAAAAGDVAQPDDDVDATNKKRKLKETTTTTKKRRIGGAFLPPDGVFPMAASAGYLSLLPALLDARTPLPRLAMAPRPLLTALGVCVCVCRRGARADGDTDGRNDHAPRGDLHQAPHRAPGQAAAVRDHITNSPSHTRVRLTP